MSLTRRAFVVGLPAALAACTSTQAVKEGPKVSAYHNTMYAAVEGEPFPVPAPNLKKIEPQYYRREVAYSSGYVPGTVIIDTQKRFLYLQQENGRALRYGIGVGKAGLEFEGEGTIQYKRQWPSWTPTPDMIKREPERYGPLASGMAPGPTNPLGARALYLFKDGRDTLYRIHGSNEDWSIGRAISSGCIRLLNQDIIDLYTRIPNGTKVVVLQGNSGPMASAS
ncbi:L,D-transpeptidase [Paenochrobactrum glaciei]|uniref:L,D-transpeptidase n=1 Tax=Paenochrobactrum glaciei TaxID=486407 RepID=A0ABP3RAL9_9HYPH